MPELPEVQTVVDTIRPYVVGRTIRKVVLNRQDICTPVGTDLCKLLIGRTITGITRRAKRIIFTLDNGHRFYIHLGMTGNLIATTPKTPMAKHTHLMMDCRSSIAHGRSNPRSAIANRQSAITEIRFIDPRRFGGVWWLGDSPDDPAALGPEPLTLRPADLARRLVKTARPIKSALLDQSLIAGLGNIYVDESLFAARIHPLTRANLLTPAQIAALSRSIKTVLRRAIKAGGSTLRDHRDAAGNPGRYQKRHQVYDRAARPCRRCQTPIQRIVLAGRSTHFCSICQPKPKAKRSPLSNKKARGFKFAAVATDN